MSDIRQAFAEALKDLRLGANLAQTDFPPIISREHVSLLERGLRAPTLETIDMLAQVLGVSPLALIIQCYLIRDPSVDMDHLLSDAVQDVRYKRVLARRGISPDPSDGTEESN
ncbi:helix-turn-helix transcriptional regulator [Pseudomonas monteilii]|uniref:helix-turn-helix domain-containing protein n=1 Tax=Pseudomonas TaxID=286 RepID=UPI0006877A5C|nr:MULTISPECIES: helix-turn-helix transcriptional regulator [Pseudomonas]MBA1317253.1 helix-turn-helix transcriptional regulator [Pseudomonas monteilii]MBA6090925.1 helix-turn-helix transcriptional regulator [Pseudomonas monteilii]MDH0022725.1 helix-turn-helix domain-containing protein [Pseudomonas monteilii]